MKERSANRQLAINMIASLSTFAVGLGVRFFLTPYIVGTLGREAYGFIGLSADILSYTGLVTIALNSMAGRFVTIKYTAGDIEVANKYYSSVFFSNVVLSGFTILFASGCILYLEHIVRIPQHLIFDVKLLFGSLALNNVIGRITGIWGVSTFIKNRLDLTNVRGIIGNFINAALLVCLFTFFVPHIWYMGVAGLIMTLYVALTNKGFSRLLTPDLQVRFCNYDWRKAVELVKSGAWNLVTRLGSILGHELDLLMANVFIGASVMGQFAITKGIPFLILSLFQTISGVFAPNFTALYAQGRQDELISEIRKSMRILSLFSAIPLACLYFYGKEFYGLWLPTEDAGRLQMLTVLGTFALPYTLPLESLWSIFTVTNKLKYSSIFAIADNLVVFVVVMTCMLVLKTPESRLLALASTRSLCGVVRGFAFLPLYGAYCLELPLFTFYKTILRSLCYISVCFAACYFMRLLYVPTTWFGLVSCGLFVGIVCIAISVVIVLTHNDRAYVLQRVLKR